MPGVTVTVTNLATNVSTVVKTNEAGIFEAPFLTAGTYNLSAEMAGFRTVAREQIELRMRDQLRFELAMQIGETSDRITVTAETPLLDTTSASMGQVVDQRRMADLPVAHGNPYLLMTLAAGVVYTSNPGLDRPFEPGHIVGYAMGGTAALKNEVSLDGSPNTMVSRSTGSYSAGYTPPADIVQELKVEATTFDASTGHTQGGATAINLKSGGNEFHGTTYYSLLRPELNSNLFFANKAGQPKGDFTYHRWGGTATGPVRIPGLYNGRDKTFFVYAFERIDESRAVGAAYGEGNLTVPTAAQREGDFSALLALGSNYQIYDPSTRVPASGGRTRVDPFPGNIIPKSRINPIATNILSYYSLPNAPGTADGQNNLIRVNDPEVIDYWNHTVKIDHHFNSSHRMFVRGSGYKRHTSWHRDWFRSAASGQSTIWFPKQVAVDNVVFFNSTTFMNVRYSLYALQISQGPDEKSREFDLASLGFPQAYVDAIPKEIRRFPGISINGYTGTQDNWYDYRHHSNTIEANLTMVRGGHSVKFGVDARNYRGFNPNWGNVSTGSFTFNPDFVRGPLDNAANSPRGQGMATLLLGLPTAGQVLRNTYFAQQSTYWSMFVHDTWRVTPKLTLNAGLRWEIEGPVTERFNRSVRGYDFSTINPLDAQVRANYAAAPQPELDPNSFYLLGGLTFAGHNGQPRTLWNRDLNNLAPRLGLAYQFNPKTVIRAGYGLYYGQLGVQRVGDVNLTGFQRYTRMVPTLDNGLTFKDTLSNPFPDGILEPRGNADGIMTFAGQSVRYFNENPQANVSQRFMFSIMRELPKRVVLELAYIGGRSSSLERTNIPLRSLPLNYYSRLPYRDTAHHSYMTSNVPSPFYPLLPGTSLAGQNVSRQYLLQSNPQFSHFNSIQTTVDDGYANYNSLNGRIERRFANGFTLNGIYVWSKNMQALTKLNGEFDALEYVISDQDRPHRVVVSGIYELPFGRGRTFLNGGGAVDKIFGGWQVQGIFTAQSGAALGFGNVFFNGNLQDITLPASERRVEQWFNTKAGFVTASAQQPSYAWRTMSTRFSNIRGDGTNLWDLSVIKNTSFSDRVTAQFRGEFLNAMNHPNFSNPNTTVTSTAFGTVTSQSGYPRRIQLGLKLLF